MVTLKELVNNSFKDTSDIQIIKAYFTLNDLEEEGIDLINELSKSKISKLKRLHGVAREWVCMLPSSYLYANYDLETADKLHNLELDFLLNGCEYLSDSKLNWAKNNVPNIKRPECYFNPLIDYMDRQGIEFK